MVEAVDQRAEPPLAFDHLPGWADDDFDAAFLAFCKSAQRMAIKPYPTRANGVSGEELARLGALALDCAGKVDGRTFFETHFEPVRLHGGPDLLTGYFEPVVPASPVKTARFRFPLHRRPDDLVDIDEANRPSGMNPACRFGKKIEAGIVEYDDRGAIQAGALDGRGLELCYLASPVDAYFIHVQGSARLEMTNGSVMRVTFAAKSGHAYTSLGAILRQRLDLSMAEMSADRLRNWMERQTPGDLAAFLALNRSYIFFEAVEGLGDGDGPLAAAKVPLTPGRSLAVDRTIHTFASPFFVTSQEPLPGHCHPLRRLMIAQDTGSAIQGPARGDFFTGSGVDAGEFAGKICHQATFFLLKPRRVS